MENKKIIHILALSGIVVPIYAIFFDYECIFKNAFNIPCISCGLTRSFRFILQFKLVESIKMNILGIPLFIVCIVFYFLYFLNLLFKNNCIYNYYNYFVMRYKLIIFVLSLSWSINIVKYLFFL